MSVYFKKNQAFTLVELTVSLAVMATIFTVVLLNQRTYTEGIALTNLADEIGITLSQAQAYGNAVKASGPGSTDFSAAYGVSVNLGGDGSSSAYIFFIDRDIDGVYDGDISCVIGPISECLDKVNLSRGNYIEKICMARFNDTEQCNLANRAEISFIRPQTGARIFFKNNGDNVPRASNVVGAKIYLKSPSGLIRTVTVYDTGQISVQ